ncbi:hypothetical protein HWV54_02825 [Bartonella alsatica]|uniref:Phage protein n=2 Tax=Bartonella alsatica TaxID=52764 RepID=J1IRH1_9HYPH|nr:hypothetical protein [Bartonella alsatica]EJF74107.1 hypothetical protein MEC_01349 [Bartonella alsatica IBS 382]QLC51855.1 hypothetical protein HWV54_02825 [Bartonella alsatica]
MDQEHLTPDEHNQLKQGFLSGTEQRGDTEIGEGEKVKTLEENVQGHQDIQKQQRSLQEGITLQDVQGEAERETPPDPQKDFMGYIQWLGKALYKQGALLSEQSPSTVSEAEQLHDFYQQSVVSVKQKHHDFDQAADFIYDTRANQLAAYAALYPEMADPNVIDAVIGNELKQIVRDCAKKNQNPAEVIYTIAQKIGYTNVPNNNSENLQERHNSARTLAAYNGLNPSGPISLDMLDKMSETEFSIWVTDPKNKAAFNRLMGGGES